MCGPASPNYNGLVRQAAARRTKPSPRTRPFRVPAGAAPAALERRLEEAEARYRSLVALLPVVAYVSAFDVQGAFVYVSPQVTELLGYAPAEWIARRGLWLKRMVPADRLRVLPLLGRRRPGGGFSAEYRLLDRAGRIKWIKDDAVVIRDGAGKPLFTQGIWTDISERKRIEKESAARGRELDSSRSEIAQFISIASHELKAPLRRIVNLSELLAQRAQARLDAAEKALLGRIAESASSMQALVAALVEYGDASGRRPLVPVDLGRSLDRALEDLAETIAASGARITRGELPRVMAEPVLLATLLRALVDNAIKFKGAEAPRVHVYAERSDGELRVAVRDNGIGIHPGQAHRIFALFDRLHPPERYAGLGVGLAMAKKIVEGFGGRIWVDSAPGDGATIRFTARPAVPGPP